LAAAALAGAITAFGQAPYELAFLLVLGLSAVVWLAQSRVTSWQAALTGWAFGTGYFAHALQWIVSPFLVDAARHGWMAPFALIFLAAGLALFWGLAFWVARRLHPTSLWPLVLTWPAVELLRAYVFTGFPWAMPAQAMVNTHSGQLLALVGPYGLNLIVIALAVLIGRSNRGSGTRSAVEAVLGAGLAVAILFPFYAPEAALSDKVIRLIQPNAAQRDKWDPDQVPVFFDRQLRYTAALPEGGGPPPDLVLWSETAIPWVLDLADGALMEIAEAAGDATVALGVQRRDPGAYFNSMVVLGQGGAVAQIYDKHHLVPFGEYMPFSDLMARIGIFGLAQRARGGYASGVGPKLLDFGPLGRALPLICYEAVFAHDVNAAPERPDFLVQITNDAWFGKGAGPRQHLAQARMRAIEQGLPLARAANTGISAMIDPKGRVLASLPLNMAGFVDASLPKPLAPTFYSRTGDWPFAFVLLLGLAATAFRARRRQQRFSD
jgi:apolipoprotein N-acyltransferase